MTPVSIRTNNPGAQWFGPIARQYGATGTENLSDGNNAAVFPDPVHGAAAQFALWGKKYAGMPLSAAISKWSGGNSSPAYSDFISKMTGLSGNTALTPDVLAGPAGLALAKAQAKWETGRDYPMSDDQWKQAQSLAFNGAQPSGDLGSSPAQSAITQAMSGGNNATGPDTSNGDDASIPANAKPVMFSNPNSVSNAMAGNVPDTGFGSKIGLSPSVGSALAALGRGLVTASNPQAGAQLQNAALTRQMAGAGKITQVGTDMWGHPTYGVFNALNGTLSPLRWANGAAQGSGDGSSGGTSDTTGGGTSTAAMGGGIGDGNALITKLNAMTGATAEDKIAYLKKVSPAAASVVQGLVNGSEEISGLPRQGEGKAAWMAIAQAVDPNFKGNSDYQQRVAQAKAEASSGVFGKNNKSADQLMGHLDQLDKAIDNAQLSRFPLANRIGNFIADQTGQEGTQSALGTLRAAAEAPAQELVSLMRNNGGAEADIKAWRDQFNTADSPATMKASLRQGVNTMHSIIQANVNQHNRIFHENKTVNDYLSPESQGIINRLNGKAAPAASQAAPAASDPLEGRTVTNPQTGHTLLRKGGQWLDAETGQPVQ